jgi:hypothetical protein
MYLRDLWATMDELSVRREIASERRARRVLEGIFVQRCQSDR